MPISKISVNGGVAKNDHICQIIANLQGATLLRAKDPESSARGAAFLAAGDDENDEIESDIMNGQKDVVYEKLFDEWKKYK